MVTTISESDMRVVVHKTCGLAAQTFMLAMAEIGYDTCPLEGFDSRRVKRLLKLPCSAEINMIIPVSYTHLDVYKRQGWTWQSYLNRS